MDLQHGILGRRPDADDLLARVAATIATARRLGLTIGHVRVGFSDEDHPDLCPARRRGRRRPGGARRADGQGVPRQSQVITTEDLPGLDTA
ncbi:hypothetical protein [Aquihabitans sp. McL0605]|uniref:hypothetical protein n=1 Tax=Aquihabitans sp. McL0605 TaxID=3415671 RepID=UPI003CECB085